MSSNGNVRRHLLDRCSVDPAPILRAPVGCVDALLGNDRDIALMLRRRFHGDAEARRAAATEAAFAALPACA